MLTKSITYYQRTNQNKTQNTAYNCAATSPLSQPNHDYRFRLSTKWSDPNKSTYINKLLSNNQRKKSDKNKKNPKRCSSSPHAHARAQCLDAAPAHAWALTATVCRRLPHWRHPGDRRCSHCANPELGQVFFPDLSIAAGHDRVGPPPLTYCHRRRGCFIFSDILPLETTLWPVAVG